MTYAPMPLATITLPRSRTKSGYPPRPIRPRKTIHQAALGWQRTYTQGRGLSGLRRRRGPISAPIRGDPGLIATTYLGNRTEGNRGKISKARVPVLHSGYTGYADRSQHSRQTRRFRAAESTGAEEWVAETTNHDNNVWTKQENSRSINKHTVTNFPIALMGCKQGAGIINGSSQHTYVPGCLIQT
jgi:hypothetical protein